jgi:hypothetical protein
MAIAQAAHRTALLQIENNNVVLVGPRRNGRLNWRPSLSSDKMEEPEALSKLEIGSRMRNYWLHDRMSWLGEAGRPKPTNWSR